MVYNHGAMIPGGRPRVNRKTKLKKKITSEQVVADTDQASQPELEPESVLISPDSEFKRGYNSGSGIDIENPYFFNKEEKELMSVSLDAVEADDVITEDELEAEVVSEKPKKKRKKRSKKKVTEVS